MNFRIVPLQEILKTIRMHLGRTILLIDFIIIIMIIIVVVIIMIINIITNITAVDITLSSYILKKFSLRIIYIKRVLNHRISLTHYETIFVKLFKES